MPRHCPDVGGCYLWLGPIRSIDDLKTVLKPYGHFAMEAYAVNRAVNSVKPPEPLRIESELVETTPATATALNLIPMIATECASHVPMKAPMKRERAVKVEKAAAARRACSAASAETVAALAVASGASAADAARLTNVATSTVANAHAKNP